DPARALPFLDRHGPVDTRAVALRCIERMFEYAPPERPEAFEVVSTRVEGFALKFLDPDVFASGENAVIAQNAGGALAALGLARISPTIEAVIHLERRWMNHQIKMRLVEFLTSWRQSNEAVVGHTVFQRIQEQASRLS